jgi:hypothetical protein
VIRRVITDTVYRRPRHPFLSPPATIHPGERLHTLLGMVFISLCIWQPGAQTLEHPRWATEASIP